MCVSVHAVHNVPVLLVSMSYLWGRKLHEISSHGVVPMGSKIEGIWRFYQFQKGSLTPSTCLTQILKDLRASGREKYHPRKLSAAAEICFSFLYVSQVHMRRWPGSRIPCSTESTRLQKGGSR